MAEDKAKFEFRSIEYRLPLCESDFLSSEPLGRFQCTIAYYLSTQDEPRSTFMMNLEEDSALSSLLNKDRSDVLGAREKRCVQVNPLEVTEVSNRFKLRGNRFFKTGAYDNAFGCYSKAINYSNWAHDPVAVYYQNRAAVLEAREDWSEVIDDFTEALRINPTYVKALHRRSRAFAAMYELEEALDDAAAADILLKSSSVEDNVKNTTYELSLRLGRVLAESWLSGEVDDDDGFLYPASIKHLRSYIEDINSNVFNKLVGNDDDPLFSDIKEDLRNEKYNNIEAKCTELIELNGAHKYRAMLLRGMCKFCMHDREGALRDFDDIISNSTNESQEMLYLKIEAMTERAYLKYCTNDFPGAEEDFKMAVIMDPKSPTTYHKRAKFEYYVDVRSSEDVKADYCLAISLDPEFLTPRLCFGDYLLKEDEIDSAGEVIAETVRLFPLNSDAWQRHAKFLLKTGRKSEAIEAINKSIDLAPWRAQPYADKAFILLTDENDYRVCEQVLPLTDKALDLDDECHTLCYCLAHMETTFGNYEKAIPMLEKSIDCSPRSVEELHVIFALLELCKAHVKNKNLLELVV